MEGSDLFQVMTLGFVPVHPFRTTLYLRLHYFLVTSFFLSLQTHQHQSFLPQGQLFMMAHTHANRKIRPSADWHSTERDQRPQFQLTPGKSPATPIDQPSASSQRLAGSSRAVIAQRRVVLRSANPLALPSTAAESGPTNEKVRIKFSCYIMKVFSHMREAKHWRVDKKAMRREQPEDLDVEERGNGQKMN